MNKGGRVSTVPNTCGWNCMWPQSVKRGTALTYQQRGRSHLVNCENATFIDDRSFLATIQQEPLPLGKKEST
eukprot:1074755-Amphidinium_carterae.1